MAWSFFVIEFIVFGKDQFAKPILQVKDEEHSADIIRSFASKAYNIYQYETNAEFDKDRYKNYTEMYDTRKEMVENLTTLPYPDISFHSYV